MKDFRRSKHGINFITIYFTNQSASTGKLCYKLFYQIHATLFRFRLEISPLTRKIEKDNKIKLQKCFLKTEKLSAGLLGGRGSFATDAWTKTKDK